MACTFDFGDDCSCGECAEFGYQYCSDLLLEFAEADCAKTGSLSAYGDPQQLPADVGGVASAKFDCMETGSSSACGDLQQLSFEVGGVVDSSFGFPLDLAEKMDGVCYAVMAAGNWKKAVEHLGLWPTVSQLAAAPDHLFRACRKTDLMNMRVERTGVGTVHLTTRSVPGSVLLSVVMGHMAVRRRLQAGTFGHQFLPWSSCSMPSWMHAYVKVGGNGSVEDPYAVVSSMDYFVNMGYAKEGALSKWVSSVFGVTQPGSWDTVKFMPHDMLAKAAVGGDAKARWSVLHVMRDVGGYIVTASLVSADKPTRDVLRMVGGQDGAPWTRLFVACAPGSGFPGTVVAAPADDGVSAVWDWSKQEWVSLAGEGVAVVPGAYYVWRASLAQEETTWYFRVAMHNSGMSGVLFMDMSKASGLAGCAAAVNSASDVEQAVMNCEGVRFCNLDSSGADEVVRHMALLGQTCVQIVLHSDRYEIEVKLVGATSMDKVALMRFVRAYFRALFNGQYRVVGSLL